MIASSIDARMGMAVRILLASARIGHRHRGIGVLARIQKPSGHARLPGASTIFGVLLGLELARLIPRAGAARFYIRAGRRILNRAGTKFPQQAPARII